MSAGDLPLFAGDFPLFVAGFAFLLWEFLLHLFIPILFSTFIALSIVHAFSPIPELRALRLLREVGLQFLDAVRPSRLFSSRLLIPTHKILPIDATFFVLTLLAVASTVAVMVPSNWRVDFPSMRSISRYIYSGLGGVFAVLFFTVAYVGSYAKRLTGLAILERLLILSALGVALLALLDSLASYSLLWGAFLCVYLLMQNVVCLTLQRRYMANVEPSDVGTLLHIAPKAHGGAVGSESVASLVVWLLRHGSLLTAYLCLGAHWLSTLWWRSRDPANRQLEELRALVYYRFGRFSTVIKTAERFSRGSADRSPVLDAYKALAQARLGPPRKARENLEKALETLGQALEQWPNDPLILQSCAYVHWEARAPGRASEWIERAIKAVDTQPERYGPEVAIPALAFKAHVLCRDALQGYPRNPTHYVARTKQAYATIVDARRRLGAVSGNAEGVFLEDQLKHSEAHVSLLMRDYETAEQLFTESVAESFHLGSRFCLGLLELSKSNYNHAISHFRGVEQTLHYHAYMRQPFEPSVTMFESSLHDNVLLNLQRAAVAYEASEILGREIIFYYYMPQVNGDIIHRARYDVPPPAFVDELRDLPRFRNLQAR
jgi:tetratricopeptide (TPR) repeat protein